MFVRVTCAGVVIGTAQFDPPQGLAHALLTPTTHYAICSRPARALSRRLARTEYWPSGDGDFAKAAAARWRGGRLAVEDMTGRELDVRNVTIVEGEPDGPDGAAVRVVADFRPDRARVHVHADLSARPKVGARSRLPDRPELST